MNQDNLDKQIREAYKDLDQNDFDEAVARKEKIWNELQPEPKSNERNNLWVLLFLGALVMGSLLFALGWFLKKPQVQFEKGQTPRAQQAIAQKDDTKMKALELAVFELQEALKLQQKGYDSLSVANRDLAGQLTGLSQINTSTVETKVITKYIQDTVYLTEVKVDKQVVEKIIKDTVFIEIPIQNEFLETAEVSSNETQDKGINSEQSESKRRSSVQFNFSETRVKGK